MESETLYRLLAESLDDVVFITDGRGIITYVSPLIGTLYGLTLERVVGRDYREFVHPDDLARLKEGRIRDVRRNRFLHEIRVFDGRGATRHVRAFGRFHVMDDVPVRAIGIVTDITDRKRAKKLWRKGEIISGVANELNNSLSAILGNAQLLMREELPPYVRKKVMIIRRESERSASIIRGVSAFSGTHRSERLMANVNTMIGDMCRPLGRELKADNTAVLLDLGNDIPDTALDYERISHVFATLITNARQSLFEKGGGTVVIRTYHRDNTIFIEVSDDGPGIAPESLDSLFSTAGKAIAGMRLPIAHEIVRQHGGRIDVTSELGAGAVFTVALPVFVVKGHVRPPDAVRVPPSKRRGKILVIDDEKSVRDFMYMVLTDEGYTVRTVTDGDMALDLIESEEYDVVVSDMKMPRMTGEDLYYVIREKNPRLAERFIVVTGDVLNEKTLNFLKTTGNPFIEKPFRIHRLLAVVAEVISNTASSDSPDMPSS